MTNAVRNDLFSWQRKSPQIPPGAFLRSGIRNNLRAAYNLFDCEDVTFQAIASHHRELTKKTAGKRLLIIADTTEIDYGPCRQVTGLSPVGSGIGQGFHLHSGLMVSAEDDRVHGLAGQLIFTVGPFERGDAGRAVAAWRSRITDLG